MLNQLKGDGFTGEFRWIEVPQWAALGEVGAMYYPSPAAKDFAFSPNVVNPAAFSFMGVTFTLSSTGAMDQIAEPWPTRADPFARFAHFPTQTLGGNWQVRPQPDAAARLCDLLGLSMAGYAFDAALLPKEGLAALLTMLEKQPSQSVNELLTAAGLATPPGVRALMWLWKFDLVRVMPG